MDFGQRGPNGGRSENRSDRSQRQIRRMRGHASYLLSADIGTVNGHRAARLQHIRERTQKRCREVNKLPSTSGVRDLMAHKGRRVTTVTGDAVCHRSVKTNWVGPRRQAIMQAVPLYRPSQTPTALAVPPRLIALPPPSFPFLHRPY